MFGKNQFKEFSVEENGFYFKGEFHAFNDIVHITFARINTTTSMNFVKLGEEQSVGMLLELDSGEQIKLKEAPGLIFTSDKQNINNIIDYYIFLSEKTFQK